ncbi:MAG: asparagine synthase (glutamine-hydrolyzing) [Euryarchaeota archaeon]|nr:asparagine synthase (glutamine-hydrolyzing) [Euryarchaeota archaeon]
MCGITGFVSFRADALIDGHLLQRMTKSLAHRGPNDSGCVLIDRLTRKTSLFSDSEDYFNGNFDNGHIGLGHRRLSILDLSSRGRQPMQGAGGKVWLAFNGEIYNYLEIKEELKRLDHTFISSTDTEVLLKSYLQWGVECFKRFNGTWGVAIYDMRDETLVLSRDRFGKKPLYYYKDNSKILFASEVKALLKHPEIEAKVNEQKVINYAGRHYRYVDNDNESYFKDILQVPPSSYIVFNSKGKNNEKRYWQLTEQPLLSGKYTEKDIVEEFRTLLTDAVKIRLRSDVPVGSMLSGGMDSSSITCLAMENNCRIRAFSGVTGDGYYDESEYIDALVRQIGIDHSYVYPRAEDLFHTLEEMLFYHDEPICTVTWYCNYLITKEIAKHNIPVILTGHGGDELLAGYWDHYHYYFAELRASGVGDVEEVTRWQQNHQRPWEEYERERGYVERLRCDKSIELPKHSRYLECLSPELLKHDDKRLLVSPFRENLSRRLYLELMYETIPPSLRAEDRNMMAFSIENRVPLLDYRLVEFCFNLDSSKKIRNGLGKWLLREAMKGILPEKIRTRKDKTGFNAPFDQWIRNENRAEIEALIHRKSMTNEIIYRQDAVKALYEEHLSGANHYMFFWQYINLNIWMETLGLS